MATTNQRKQIRDKVEALLIASGSFSAYTIQSSRMIGLPKELLPALLLFNGTETWEETIDRAGYQVKGDFLVRAVVLAKLPPEELNTGELYADDQLDEIGTLIEPVLTGPRASLEGVVNTFSLADQVFGFSEGKDKETLAHLTIRFNYLYKVAFAV